ncbi:restriction endonuclease subunit S [Aquirufa regiilacus]
MNKYFNKIKLGELTEIIAGGDKPKVFSENKNSINTVPVFANAEGNNGLQGYTDIPRIIEPAVTISARGSKVGFAALRKEPFFPIVRLLTLIPQKDKLDVDYLFYNLKLNRQNGTGSGQPQITIPEISEKIISVPPLLTQQKIASVLSALDSKIGLNNRINEELEAMAKTIYNYWFVQFDFPDKNGKPYNSSGGKMVWNEELKREIPEGWQVKSIEDCCKIIDCLHSKKPDTYFDAEKYYLLQLENLLDNGLIDVSYKYYVSRDEYFKWTSRIEVKEHDILITNAGRVAATTQVPKEIVTGIGRNITAIRPMSISPTYLFLSFRGIDIVKQIKSNTDSGAFFSSFNVKGIKRLNFLIPPHKIESNFENIVYPIRRKREMNLIENQQLVSLRDWLLPMLMNGQLKIQ